ncbi:MULTISPECIES: hypothetical protein [Streptomyces]|nr:MULTISPECIES: hypothetical protein [Streptomyces]
MPLSLVVMLPIIASTADDGDRDCADGRFLSTEGSKEEGAAVVRASVCASVRAAALPDEAVPDAPAGPGRGLDGPGAAP